jgi:5-methylcytosine-specific restriction endonuclease McrA
MRADVYRWCPECEQEVDMRDWNAHYLTHHPKPQRPTLNRASVIASHPYCEQCGTTARLEVHHIDGNWKNNQPANLQVLCRTCHRGPGNSVENQRRKQQ